MKNKISEDEIKEIGESIKDGDFLASPDPDSDDVYRIEKETFDQTYKKD